MAVALVLGACSGNGSASEDDEGAVAGEGPIANRPETNPPGTEPAAVAPHVSELLLAYDRAVDEIVADPSVAEDPEDPMIQEFLGLFEEDSEVAAAMVEGWVERADEGLRTLPYRDDYPASESRLNGEVETVSEDEVAFSICVTSRTRVVDADGEEVGTSLPSIDYPGEGTAVRTEEGWRLQDLAIWVDQLTCPEEDLTGGDEE